MGRPGRPHIHAVMAAHAHEGDLAGAEAWLRVMGDRGMAPDTYSYNILLSTAAKVGDPDAAEAAEALLERMEADGLQPDLVTYSTIIDVMGEAGKPDEAFAWLIKAEDNG